MKYAQQPNKRTLIGRCSDKSFSNVLVIIKNDRRHFFDISYKILKSATLAVFIPGAATANGYGESSPWQFESYLERGANTALLDMIERKKGGYYDGFKTTINNSTITNVGTQINCNNVADATGNTAQNSQGGNSVLVDAAADITSTNTGNDSLTGTDSGTGSSQTTQDNSGTLNSDVTGSSVNTTTGGTRNGDTDNGLNNTQENSGNQSSTIADSVACDMRGSTVEGNVDGTFSGQELNGPVN